MQLVIAERLRPFSHSPGTTTILPGAGYQVQIYPCLLRLYSAEGTVLLKEIALELTGPIEQFTLCNDLEKGRITVWGQTVEGYFRYHVMSGNLEKSVRLSVEKAPGFALSIVDGDKRHSIQKGEFFDLIKGDSLFNPYQPPLCDRLSLGCHKGQDWDLIKRRLSLDEIFPLWHRLGQLVNIVHNQRCNEGVLSLLEQCKEAFAENKPELAQQQWLNLFRAGFRSLLVPRLEDDDYQGLVPSHPGALSTVSPLVLLSEGARLIRQMFIQQAENRIEILPLLFPSLHCGRLIDVRLEGGGVLSLEWTKKTIRRMTLRLEEDRELFFHFRSNVRRYRLRESTKDRGKMLDCNAPVPLRGGWNYFFDNFV